MQVSKSEPVASKSLLRLINFFKFFGLSFGGVSLNNRQDSVWSFLQVLYNLLMVVWPIVVSLTFVNMEMFSQFRFRIIIKVILIVSFFSLSVEALATFVLCNIRSRRFLRLKRLEDVPVDDQTMMRVSNRIIGTLLFNLSGFVVVFLWHTLDSIRTSLFKGNRYTNLLAFASQLPLFMSSSFMPAVYIYINIKIAHQIKSLTTYKDIGFIYDQLIVLRRNLLQLEELISIPIFLTVAMNSILILSSSCLLFTQGSLITYSVAGLTMSGSLSKLLVIIHFGECIPKAFTRLRDELRQRHLHNYELIALDHLVDDFRFRVSKMFTMEWSTFVAIIAFVLQYSVILVQTDNQNMGNQNATANSSANNSI